MSNRPPHLFALQVVLRAGQVLDDPAGRVALMFDLIAMRLGPRQHGGCTIAERPADGSMPLVREIPVTLEQLAGTIEAFQEAAVTERSPRLAEVTDTSDGFATASVNITINQAQRAFEFQQRSSGLQGADARAIYRAFGSLLKALDIQNEDAWRYLAGRR